MESQWIRYLFFIFPAGPPIIHGDF